MTIPKLCFIGATLCLAPAATAGEGERLAILTADLPRSVAQAVGSDSTDAATVLARVTKALAGEELDLGLVHLSPDPRWFVASPPEQPGAAFLELRRWPGDSVIALYALDDTARPGSPPPLSGSEPSAPDSAALPAWRGTIQTPGGRRAAAWIEQPVSDQERRLGMLLVPGDAGLGLRAVPILLDEMVAIAARVAVRPEAWRVAEVIPAGATLLLPRLLPPPSRADEIRDVWQSLYVAGYSFGLPPGLRAVQLAGGLRAPNPVDQAMLWFRGGFADRDGLNVIVGDGIRAGYVSILKPADHAWRSGERKPLGAKTATRVASEDFLGACESTGASAASAERWSEPGFVGDWIVFRLLYADQGIEVGLPVLSGRQSEALFWLPATWRPPGVSPAPPPMDPAARFGISYRPLTKLEKADQPWMEGVLAVPGLRIEIPRNWWAIANLRSEDGFPVLFFADGRKTGKLVRHPVGSPAIAPPSLDDWQSVKKASKKSTEAIYAKDPGLRLYVTARGEGLLFEPEGGTIAAEWQRMIETATALRQSVAAGAHDKGAKE